MGHVEGHHDNLSPVGGQQVHALGEMLMVALVAKLPFQHEDGGDVHGAACGFRIKKCCVGGAESHKR